MDNSPDSHSTRAGKADNSLKLLSESSDSSVMILDSSSDSSTMLYDLELGSTSPPLSPFDLYQSQSPSSSPLCMVPEPFGYSTPRHGYRVDQSYWDVSVADGHFSTSSSPTYLLSSPVNSPPPHTASWVPETAPNSQTASDSQSINQLLYSICCSKRCLANLSVVEIERSREWFTSRSTIQQNQFLLDSFHISGNPTQPDYNILEGKVLCKKAFAAALGISSKRYTRIYDNFREGVMQFTRKQIVRRSHTAKVSEAKAWMEIFFTQIGDHMPHINQIHLPHVMTRRDVYQRMKNDLLDVGLLERDIISQSYFYTIWRKFYRHVVIPEV